MLVKFESNTILNGKRIYYVNPERVTGICIEGKHLTVILDDGVLTHSSIYFDDIDRLEKIADKIMGESNALEETKA